MLILAVEYMLGSIVYMNILAIEQKADLQWECYLYLGKLNLTWNNDKEAKNYLLNSLQAIKTSHNKESINEGDVLEVLAELHEFRGEINESINWDSFSLSILAVGTLKLKPAQTFPC